MVELLRPSPDKVSLKDPDSFESVYNPLLLEVCRKPLYEQLRALDYRSRLLLK
jgi:hypothetical protein